MDRVAAMAIHGRGSSFGGEGDRGTIREPSVGSCVGGVGTVASLSLRGGNNDDSSLSLPQQLHMEQPHEGRNSANGVEAVLTDNGDLTSDDHLLDSNILPHSVSTENDVEQQHKEGHRYKSNDDSNYNESQQVEVPAIPPNHVTDNHTTTTIPGQSNHFNIDNEFLYRLR